MSTTRKCLGGTVALVFALAPAMGQSDSDAPPPPSRALLAELTSEARLAGTCGSLRAAKFVARTLEAAGWRVELDERVVLLSLPRRIEFRVFADAEADEPLLERVERFDPDAIPPGDVPHYSAWSASGRVRGPVVDVGRGLRADYERLGDSGVVLTGAIALARYGGAYRGVKVDLATEYGCAAVLLYSDPADDGDVRGPTWPVGPWKPDWAAQRGSILPIALAPGDPTTPGVGSPRPGERVERLSPDEVDARLPRILCLPIGVREVRKLWQRMQMSEQDANPSKPLGPGPVEVELVLDIPRELRTIRNVIATLPGADEKLVIAGNHRDAWVRGANDAGSGTVSLLRAAQHLGERAKSGWKPLHTLVLGFWDAEEFGLIGSTEWGEANADRLRRDGLVYVNGDTVVQGTHFGASGAPGLVGGMREALAAAPNALELLRSFEEWAHLESVPTIDLPGSGSDFAVFAHHLAMPVLDVGFSGNSGGGYHTSFDDFAMVERFLDPGFVGHELAGKFLGGLLAGLAEDPRGGFNDIEAARSFAARAREAGAEKGAGGEPWLGPTRADKIAHAFELLEPAIESGYATNDGPAIAVRGLAPGETPTAEELARQASDRAWLAGGPKFYATLAVERGLAGREWFKNQIWAPGVESGYGSESWPLLRAAARNGEAELDRAVDALVAQIDALAARWRDRKSAAAPPQAGH